MKYIAEKIDENTYKILGIKKMPTIDGEEIEVIIGTINQDKKNLEQIIKDYEEETKFFIEKQTEDFETQREEQLNELKEHLKAIKECK